MIAIALLLACSGESQPTPDGTAPDAASAGPVDGDTLVVAFPFDPSNINPIVAPYALSGMVSELVLPGLVTRQVAEDGLVYEPKIAKSFEWSDNGATLTYHLRDDLVWSDGQPITSADVAFNQELIGDPVVASNWLGNARFITSVETPDPHTVIYHFDSPKNPVLQQGFTFRGLVSQHEFASLDRGTLRGVDQSKKPIGAGSFLVDAWQVNEKIVLVPNPKAPADWKPHLDRIVIRIIPDYATRLLELQNGGIDLFPSVEPEDVESLQADPRLRVETTVNDGMQYIGYNQADSRFQDVRVRKALTLGLDREGISKTLYSVDGVAHARPCIGTIAPHLGAWFAKDVTPLPFDIDASKALLDEAGWTDTDGDGVRDRDGKKLAFSIMIQSADPKAKKASVLAQAAWKDIGVAMEISALEEKTFADRARQHDFEAILWGFGGNPKVDMTMEWRSDGQYNWYGYKNPDVDTLIDKGVSSADLAESQAAFREAQAKIYEDQPVTFLYWTDSFNAIDKRFSDTTFNTYTVLNHVERWWVPTAQQKYVTH